MDIIEDLKNYIYYQKELILNEASGKKSLKKQTRQNIDKKPMEDLNMKKTKLSLKVQPKHTHHQTDMEVTVLKQIESLANLKEFIGDCGRCGLCQGRTQVVFGSGNENADLMFVGEAPGRDEDIQGLPFIGRAGKLLTKIIEAINISREDVYIANIVKCRPPNNRNPKPEEIANCSRFLLKQIELVRPKIICALGAFAAHTLLESDTPISQLRGQFFDYNKARGVDVKIVPTFHPAYLLRNPSQKKLVWEDIQKVQNYIKGN